MKSINLPVTLSWITQRQDSLIEHTERVLAGVAGSQLPKKKFWLSLLENHLSILFTVWSIVYLLTRQPRPVGLWEEQGRDSSFFLLLGLHSVLGSHTSITPAAKWFKWFVFNKTRWLSWVSRPTRTMSSDDFWRVKVARLGVWSAG